MEKEESIFLYHTSCPACGSSDARGVYSDGHAHCFSCKAYFPAEGEGQQDKRKLKGGLLIQGGEFKPLTKRGINLDTCQKFGYQVGEHKGQKVQVASYYKSDNTLVAQHLRYHDKAFKWIGKTEELLLFGQQLWGSGGKRVVVTEGEIDAMSVAQVFNLKWPVVSIPSGVQSARKYLKQNLEWLESFEEIVIAFDNDDPGQKAAKECAMLFKSGKVRIANWSPYKDANDYLPGESGAVAPIIFQAKPFRPDGIVSGTDLSLDYLMEQDAIFAFELHYPKLSQILRGIRKGEITMFAAGSGCGKSTLVREIAYHLMMAHGLKLGYVALEESVKKTALGLLALDLNVPMGDLFLKRSIVSPEQFSESHKKTIDNGRLYLYDHFGSLESENLLAKLRYMAVACEVDFIILDHISIVVSGIEEGEERRIIDNVMTQMRSMVESTGVGMMVITHLKVPEGKPHEEGGRVTLSQLRGSGALKQLSDSIIGLERDQQGEDPNVAQVRVLKNRLIGTVGLADTLRYDPETGRLLAWEESQSTEEMF